jgi:hypothetical protein
MVVVLLLCPSLNRVMCVSRLAQPTNYSDTPSFQRSLDVPPKATVFAADNQILPVIVAVNLQPRACSRWQEQNEDPFTSPVLLPRACSLRAPPPAPSLTLF